MSKWSKPQVLSPSDYAFGPKCGVSKLLPEMREIPEEFKDMMAKSRWIQVIDDWFFAGVKLTKVVPKDGIDKNVAITHIGCIMHSWEPKHEHKTAGCAYLLSLWFDVFEYEKTKS